jgi:hypothetical protein
MREMMTNAKRRKLPGQHRRHIHAKKEHTGNAHAEIESTNTWSARMSVSGILALP